MKTEMTEIPDEVRKQIEEGENDYCLNSKVIGYAANFKAKHAFGNGAEFGYSLASKALSDANKEIQDLLLKINSLNGYLQMWLEDKKKPPELNALVNEANEFVAQKLDF